MNNQNEMKRLFELWQAFVKRQEEKDANWKERMKNIVGWEKEIDEFLELVDAWLLAKDNETELLHAVNIAGAPDLDITGAVLWYLLRDTEHYKDSLENRRIVAASILGSNHQGVENKYRDTTWPAYFGGEVDLMKAILETYFAEVMPITSNVRKALDLDYNHKRDYDSTKWIRNYGSKRVGVPNEMLGSLEELLKDKLPDGADESRAARLMDMCLEMVKQLPDEDIPNFMKAFAEALGSEDFEKNIDDLLGYLEIYRANIRQEGPAEAWNRLLEYVYGDDDADKTNKLEDVLRNLGWEDNDLAYKGLEQWLLRYIGEETHDIFEQMSKTGEGLAHAFNEGFASTQPNVQGLSDALADVEVRAAELANNQSANKAMMDLATQTKSAGKELKNADPELKKWAKTYTDSSGKAVSSIDDVIAALKEEKGVLETETTAMENNLNDMLQCWYAVRDGIEPGINGELTADGTPLFNEADNAIGVLETLLEMLSMTGGEGDGAENETRRGGGKSRRQREAEEARKAAEEYQRALEAAWQKKLDDQLKFLDRKKRLGEISTQEEIRQLEIIAAKYAKTTQQKIAMEDKLFEARARLRDEEIGQIDKLNQGIITAISNRYQEQRKIEEKRLKASSDSWREWADESVKAIQAQIETCCIKSYNNASCRPQTALTLCK